MVAAAFVLSVLCTLLASALGAPACPFDATVCTCEPDSSEKVNYTHVLCQSQTLPGLVGPNGATYTARIVTIESENVHQLPASYFKSFTSIVALNLKNNASRLVTQAFNATAFKDTKISEVYFQGIDGLLPIPDSVKVLGANGLSVLSIINHGSVNLPGSAFIDFPSLTSLIIRQVPIPSMDENALLGIDYKLQRVAMSDAGLTSFPYSTLSDLEQLVYLDVSGNQISSISQSTFNVYPRLQSLNVGGNPLADDIKNWNQNSFPASLQTIGLKNTGLTSVPTKLFSNNKQVISIDLSDNQIQQLQTADFAEAKNVEYLELENNPISVIHKGAFTHLQNVQFLVLSNISISSFDFQRVSNLGNNHTTHIFLDGNAALTSVDLMPDNKPTPQNLLIFMRNTSLTTINQRCQALLDNSGKVLMDISDNANLKCAGLEWMAPYALCQPVQVRSNNNTLCADQKDQIFDTYLANQVTNPCENRSSITSPTPTPMTTASTTPSPTTGASQVSASILLAFLAVLVIML